jgi:hypothetical protein
MNERAYLAEIATRSGLRTYPKQGPWGRKSGSAIGVRDGYIIVIGFSRIKNKAAVSVVVRFKKMEHSEVVKAAIAQSAALAEKGQGKLFEVGGDFVRWDLPYSFAKPKTERVSRLVERLCDAIKPVASSFDAKCEKCGSSFTSEMVLEDGVPMRICAGCQERVRQELNQAADKYELLEANHVNGLALGVGAALLGGFAWGLIAYLFNRIFLYGAILIGFLVARAVIKGTGKVTRAGQISIGVLTIASVLFGDAVFCVLMVMKLNAIPLSGKLVGGVLAHFWEIEAKGSGVLSMIFGLVGAGLAVYQARKPKFEVVYEPLGKSNA